MPILASTIYHSLIFALKFRTVPNSSECNISITAVKSQFQAEASHPSQNIDVSVQTLVLDMPTGFKGVIDTFDACIYKCNFSDYRK